MRNACVFYRAHAKQSLNFTAPNGKILHVFASLPDSQGTFGGNAATCSDARITAAWVRSMRKELDDDPTAVNMLSQLEGADYVILVDAGFVDPRHGKI